MRKIYVVGSIAQYARWMQGVVVSTIEEADLIVFTGGADVDPELYNQPRHSKTCTTAYRDKEETIVFKKALALGKHMCGICRGLKIVLWSSLNRVNSWKAEMPIMS